MKHEPEKATTLIDYAFILHPSAFILAFLVRLRTYPQHTRTWLPLLRSRPGGVHRSYVVRSPKSDDSLKHCQLPIANWCLALLHSIFCNASGHGSSGPTAAKHKARAPNNRQLKIAKSNRRLAVRDHAQQTIDGEVQQHINDDRDYQRHH